MGFVGPGSFIRWLGDFINGIPIVGDITAAIDRTANYVDPAQILATKVFGMDEAMATDYAHQAGLIAAFYGIGSLLSGALAGGEAAGAGAAAGGAAETTGAELAPLSSYIMGGTEGAGGLTGAEIAAGSSTAAGSSEIASLSSFLAGGSETAALGGETAAATTVSGELAPLSSYTFGNTPQLTAAEKLLANQKLINYAIRAGRAGANLASPKQEAPIYGGSSSTRVQQPLSNQDINKLMSESLGSDQSSKMFNSKENVLVRDEKSNLNKVSLSSDAMSSLTSTKVGGDLATKSRVSKGKKRSKTTGLKNVSVASPFYQQDEEY